MREMTGLIGFIGHSHALPSSSYLHRFLMDCSVIVLEMLVLIGPCGAIYSLSSSSYVIRPTNHLISPNMQVQKQLQLRIEAQGEYLQRIIEEQRRLGGVLSEDTGLTGEDLSKFDPLTPISSSESPPQRSPQFTGRSVTDS